MVALLAFAFLGVSSSARADVITPPAPYVNPANDVALGNLLGSSVPDTIPRTIPGAVPTVPNFHYPAGWDAAGKTMNDARVAGRFLPLLKTVGSFGAALTAGDVGWKIGTATYQRLVGMGYLGGNPGNLAAIQWTYTTNMSNAVGGWSGSPPAAPGWVLSARSTTSGGTYRNQIGAGEFTSAARSALSAIPAAHTNTIDASACSFAAPCQVYWATEAEMEARRTRSDAAGWASLGAAPGGAGAFSTGAYTQPSGSRAADLDAARAVMGAPVAGRTAGGAATTGNDDDDFQTGVGGPLTGGQVNGQNDTNCGLDATYCAGGVNDPTRPSGSNGTDDPGGNQAPGKITAPNCAGLTYFQCRDALEIAGFTVAPTRVILDFAGAVVTKPADAVVTQSVPAGAQVVATTVVTLTTNPAPAAMPLLIPAPLPGETAIAYRVRLVALGTLGAVSVTALPDGSPDPAFGPNEVVRTNPRTGVRVLPGTDVLVVANPATAADPTTDTGTDPGEGGSPFHAPAVPALNMAPLTHALDCTPPRFPFGIPCWTYQAVSSWVTTAPAPNFCMPFPFVHPDPCIPMDYWDPGMPIVRAMLLLMSIIGLGWMFMRAALGFGGGGGDED